jgi:hypothetical protein
MPGCIPLYLHSRNTPSWRSAQLKHRGRKECRKVKTGEMRRDEERIWEMKRRAR